MSTRDRLHEMIWQPGFHARSLEDIGKELGVTRERVRQILQDIKVKKQQAPRPASKRLAPLRAMPDEMLISLGKAAGDAKELARLFGIPVSTMRYETNRRGLSCRCFRPPTFDWLKENDHDEWRRRNTERCREWRHRDGNMERVAAAHRALRARDPKAYDVWSRRWQAKNADRLRARDRCEYQQLKGTPECPVCGQAHAGDQVRYRQRLNRTRNRDKRRKQEVSA